MARSERPSSSRNDMPNSEARRPRRVTIMNSNDDLFLNLAQDEPADPHDPEQTSQRESSKSTRPKPAKLDLNIPLSRRSASAQLDTRATLSPADADKTHHHQQQQQQLYLDRQSIPEYLRDPSSDRASISSEDQMIRNTPNESYSSRKISSVKSNNRDRRTFSAGEALVSNKAHVRPTYRQSNLAYESPMNDSPYTSQSHRPLDQTHIVRSPTDGAESVGSTTAASTVWDELEELRLRIRRLEHSGNRARSGAVVVEESADRPHTATTMTTNSSVSYPLQRLNSSPTKPVPPHPAPAYPLLQSALAKAKDIATPEVFRSLEASVSDATAVSEMTANLEPLQVANGSSNTMTSDAILQRRLRRKADSLCRSLTELCIALCEDNSKQSYRPLSRLSRRDLLFQDIAVNHEQQSPLTYLDERRARLDRSRSSPHRLSSRLSDAATEKPRGDSFSSNPRPSLFSRYSNRRSSIAEENETEIAPRSVSRAATYSSQMDNEDHDPTIRAPSRAMSEVQHVRRSSARDLQKFSRDYTARHPLPERPLLSSRQDTMASNQSNVSATSTRTSLATLRPYPRPESRTSRLENNYELSPSLAERLSLRRQQKQQQQQQQEEAEAAMQMEATVRGTTISSSRSRAFSGSGRPPSSGRRARLEQEAAVDSELSNA